MKASAILNNLSALITPPLVAAQAAVTIAQDETDAFNQLGEGVDGFLVVLAIDGEQIVHEHDPDGMVESTIVAYVQGHVSLDLLPGQSVSGTTTSTPDSFLDRIQYVIALIRGADISDEPNIDCSLGRIFRFQNWTWLRLDELPAYRAAKLEFVIRYALDDPAAARITDDGTQRLTDDGAARWLESPI